MVYYDALIAKWATLNGTVEEKLDAVNTLMIPGPNVPVPVLQIMTYLRTNNLWLQIKASQATSPGAAAAVDYNSDPRVQTLDVSLTIVQAMLADLKSHSLLNDEQIATINAMGQPALPWWQANGYQRAFDLGDVETAGLT